MILRNYTLLWAISILFEFMELTFQHMLPNFNECWWDSWILDVAVCNFIGILTGMATVRWYGSQVNRASRGGNALLRLTAAPYKMATSFLACLLSKEADAGSLRAGKTALVVVSILWSMHRPVGQQLCCLAPCRHTTGGASASSPPT